MSAGLILGKKCFTNGTIKDFALKKAARGPSGELEALMKPLFETVIPRLLRPLETSGRTLKPCFVHGDIWHETGMFDVVATIICD